MKYIKLFEEFKINEKLDTYTFPFINVDTDFADVLKKLDEEGVDMNIAKKTIKRISDRIEAMIYSKNNKADTSKPDEVKSEMADLFKLFNNMLEKDGSISDETYKNTLLKEFGDKLISLVKNQLEYVRKNK